MKYIIIPIFKILILPFWALIILLCVILNVLEALWNWEFKNLLKVEDISFKKDKPLYIHYNYIWDEPDYCYETFNDYILNKKTFKFNK